MSVAPEAPLARASRGKMESTSNQQTRKRARETQQNAAEHEYEVSRKRTNAVKAGCVYSTDEEMAIMYGGRLSAAATVHVIRNYPVSPEFPQKTFSPTKVCMCTVMTWEG